MERHHQHQQNNDRDMEETYFFALDGREYQRIIQLLLISRKINISEQFKIGKGKHVTTMHI